MNTLDDHPPGGHRVKAGGLRIERPHDLARGESFEMTIDGRVVAAFLGESVAAALLASGRRTLRMSARRGEPRGLFCGIGLCHECLVVIDGIPNQRACMAPAKAGLTLETQTGRGITADQNASDR